mgnify:CR=1 FL=1
MNVGVASEDFLRRVDDRDHLLRPVDPLKLRLGPSSCRMEERLQGVTLWIGIVAWIGIDAEAYLKADALRMQLTAPFFVAE